jgi:hypothetical protein
MYLSGYLKQHQAEYSRRLSAMHTGDDREGWVAFFLEAVPQAVAEAERSIVAITSLVAADQRKLPAPSKAGSASYRLFEMLPIMPSFTIEHARQKLGSSFLTDIAAVKTLGWWPSRRDRKGEKIMAMRLIWGC